ncbi:MAG: GWxTD domain-containing protein [Candidatus Kapabacteria bacterium]|nr:GWxTD domain-containing protein [Candidatus Kapabacteria bacterium]
MKKLILILTLSISCAFSQHDNRGEKSVFTRNSAPFYADAFFLPVINQDSLLMPVFFKISNEVLSFSKIENPQNHVQFKTIPSIEIVLTDTEGIIRKRVHWEDTIIVDSFEKTISKTDFVTGYTVIKVLNDKLRLSVSLNNNEELAINKILLDYEKHTDNILLSKPFFMYETDINSNKYFKSFILKDGIDFGAKNTSLFFYDLSPNANNGYNFTLEKITDKNAKLDWKSQISLSGKFEMIGNAELNILKLLDKQNYIQLKKNNPDYKYKLYSVSLPVEQMYPGLYRITIHKDNSTDKMIYEFNIYWREMPLSFSNVDYICEMMFNLLNDKEYDELHSGNDQKIFNKILEYWQKKDPTPETAFNEAMNTFFKRVDYALTNFKTFSVRDGAKSDRGKIYILNGQATTIDKKFEGAKSYEVWRYINIKKEYIFDQISNGVFKLTKINSIE